MRAILLCVFVAALAYPATADAQTRAIANAKIRSVDWKNRNYGYHLSLRNGRFTMRRYLARTRGAKRQCRHTSSIARLRKVRYGDLTGDGKPDALVDIYTIRDYCRGQPIKRRILIAFTWRGGKAVELGRLSLVGVKSVKISRRAIRVSHLGAVRGKWARCRSSWQVVGATGKPNLKRTHHRCKP